MTRVKSLLGLAFVLALNSVVFGQAVGERISEARYEKLRNGINVDNWFERKDGVLVAAQYTEADLKLIQAAGFRHIRLPVRTVLMNEQHPEQLTPQDIDTLKHGLDLILKYGFAVVFNPVHPRREYTARMEADTAMQTGFVRFWSAMAREFSAYDPERVFIEPMNEPFFKNAVTWYALNDRVLKAIRRAAPHHTLVVSPVKGNIDVITVTPVADQNVVYSTHFYSPFSFTHQGAPWLKRLPTGQHYPTDSLNAAYLKTDFFNPVTAWAKQHNVKVYMGEYGVLNTAGYADKLAWLTDVGRITSELKLGAALWEYAQVFSILENPKAPSNERKFDPKFLKALALK